MKQMNLRIAILTFFILMGTGCAPGPDQSQDDIAEINKMYTTYVQAVENNDLDALMSI
jgi:methionine synthase I (cobalamin-dependent)